MIFGIGLDLAKCSRFEKWVKDPKMLERFFNPKEFFESRNGSAPASAEGPAVPQKQAALSAACQHYAARFAAKEAFSKALGTGLAFDLRDIYVQKEQSGKPNLVLKNSALEALKKACPSWQSAKIFVSLTHEKEYAAAQVIIEISTCF
ncbi:MAG: holo-ACP synthase [Treponema sp.]|nr:holo-ACP synthase [Treponema sp.]